jgi:hypothetical protein
LLFGDNDEIPPNVPLRCQKSHTSQSFGNVIVFPKNASDIFLVAWNFGNFRDGTRCSARATSKLLHLLLHRARQSILTLALLILRADALQALIWCSRANFPAPPLQMLLFAFAQCLLFLPGLSPVPSSALVGI